MVSSAETGKSHQRGTSPSWPRIFCYSIAPPLPEAGQPAALLVLTPHSNFWAICRAHLLTEHVEPGSEPRQVATSRRQGGWVEHLDSTAEDWTTRCSGKAWSG